MKRFILTTLFIMLCVFSYTQEICNNGIDDDGDGVCNADEIVGCMMPTAPNYNPFATDPGLCEVGGLMAALSTFSELDAGYGRPVVTGQLGSSISQWGFVVYPNPWQGMGDLHLNFNNIPKDGEYSVALFDITGKIVMKKDLTLLKGENVGSLQIEKNLGSGTFFISVTDNLGGRNFQILFLHR